MTDPISEFIITAPLGTFEALPWWPFPVRKNSTAERIGWFILGFLALGVIAIVLLILVMQ